MPTFFEVFSTDDTPTFEAVTHRNGTWSGVAKVEDEKEAERLRAKKRREITEDEFAAAVKKKARLQSRSLDFQEIAGSAVVAPPAAKSSPPRPPQPSIFTPEPFSEPKPEPAQPEPHQMTPEDVAKPVPVPRRKSFTAKPK